ncbi:rhodanese-like domain-containing chloroplastic [Micractinium conductrix]|uniref:Rhodanese-like domain-containing chloroplastic n=1 Tax=Micractinium conductrix TaxID=554055 RepID=A0A2P6V2M9_9CHLO|nr:rhodanese-like domain-containing chloroplastic [Micractinium conductrix]|eukprot:PSC68348.1 rhodanese-like domain-containing chloroplastic [Micractinium conductrix]
MTTVQPLSGTSYTVWPVMWEYLNSKKLKQVDEDQALALIKRGAVVVDVRLADDFRQQHIEGAISVPMFRLTAGNEKWDKVKRFVMGSLAMKATERDPDFLKNFEKAVKGKRQQVIIACAVGGTLDTMVRVASTGKQCKDPDRSFGRETRSLKACYELMQAGYSNVVHLQGGLSSWRYNGYPVESS